MEKIKTDESNSSTQPSNSERYRFYREHKYISYAISELERLIAKTDFRDNLQIIKVKEQLENIIPLLHRHASYEDRTYHQLLKVKGSKLQEALEHEHMEHEALFKEMRNKFEILYNEKNEEKRKQLGYEFYLLYRKFVGENLFHLYREETIIMPELQRLYTDDELKAIDFNSYSRMAPEQMLYMIETLFPHIDFNDLEFLLNSIKTSEPEKFKKVWNNINLKLDPKEKEYLMQKLEIK